MLRIAHYNIRDGGKEQIDNVFKVIQQINPDICGILEAVGWQEGIESLKNKANVLGYNFFDLALANSKYNIAVFSKFPLVVKHIKKGFRHVVLEAVIQSGPFSGLSIFFVHFSPINEDDRLLELTNLLPYVSEFSQVIIMGDINSLSANDSYDHKVLLSQFQKNNVVKYGTDVLHFDVINKIESLGFTDASSHLNYSFTTTTPTLSNKDINHNMPIRIDYAFLSKNVLKNLSKIEILKNSITNEASDHYPLYIELI